MGSTLWDQKNTEMFKKMQVCAFFVATYGNEVISVGGHKKKHRPMELFMPFEALY